MKEQEIKKIMQKQIQDMEDALYKAFLYETELNKKNEEIKQQNEEIKAQEEELRQSNEEMMALNEHIIKQAEEQKKKDKEIKKTMQKQMLDLEDALYKAFLQEKELNKKNKEIQQKNKDITDSINYASRIQRALLPPEKTLKAILPESFVFYKPRDIVSGDFYWMKKLNGYTVITAVDCTGHGVPGAFMSMLGIAFLNEIVRKKEVIRACDVLNELRHQIKITLRQEGKEGEEKTPFNEASKVNTPFAETSGVKDGMDLALCVIDHKNMKLQYSGAYNPLYLFRKNTSGYEFIETKADRMPIGIHVNEKESFSNHEIELQKDDRFYIFSDGYADQTGGMKGRKFMTRKFKQLLLDIQELSMSEQKEKLETTIADWMQDEKQVDDILIVGVRV